jgi:hypothetical protein
MLSEDVVTRLSELLEGGRPMDPQSLRRWIVDLVADRRERIALEQRLCRAIYRLQRRQQQAFAYLDGLTRKTHELGMTSVPGKLACPECGAPAILVRPDYRPNDSRRHVLVHQHPDGQNCEAKEQAAAPAKPACEK